MSILIKGIEMPKSCDDCNLLYDYCCCIVTGRDLNMLDRKAGEKRLSNCPLIELPDHGDLIDRDALMEDLAYDAEIDERALDDTDIVRIERENLQFDRDCKQNFMYYLMEQEVVIPAERSEDEHTD